MIKYFFIIFSCILIASCSAQTDLKLYFENRSNTVVDSIIFPEFPTKNYGSLAKNQSTIIVISTILDSHEGAYNVNVWQNGKKRSSIWGFHDLAFSTASERPDSVIITDHYIAGGTKAVLKPKMFELFITDSTGGTMDSLYFENLVLQKTLQWKEKQTKYVLDYELIEKNPRVKVSIENKINEIVIPRDWSSWEYPFIGITIFSNGSFKIS